MKSKIFQKKEDNKASDFERDISLKDAKTASLPMSSSTANETLKMLSRLLNSGNVVSSRRLLEGSSKARKLLSFDEKAFNGAFASVKYICNAVMLKM